MRESAGGFSDRSTICFIKSAAACGVGSPNLRNTEAIIGIFIVLAAEKAMPGS